MHRQIPRAPLRLLLFVAPWFALGLALVRLLAADVIAAPPPATPPPARLRSSPAAAFPDNGVALGLFAEESDFDYGPLIDEIRATGATHISIVVPYYQHDFRSTAIGPHPRYSPSDAAVARAIHQARRAGLEVLLFPILRLVYQATVDEWRGAIVPRDRAAWWRSYRRFVLKHARVAAAGKCAALCVGSELSSMDRDPAPWRPLVRQVRKRFAGKLVYSANWDGFEHTAIWPLVDIAGISAYFPLVAPGERPTIRRLVHGWREVRARITRWWVDVRKPLVFTEVGYHSQRGTAAEPWDESEDKPLAMIEQQLALRAFFRAWRGAGFVRGAYIWNWFGWGGHHSREYCPRGKPAAAEVCRWFGQRGDRCPRAHGMPWFVGR